MRGRVKWAHAGAFAGGLVLLVATTGAGEPKGPSDYGFVLTKMTAAFYRGDEKVDCPEGRTPSLREAYLATQTPQERARLLKPENSVELERRYKTDYVFGPGGRDVCTSPAAFDTPDHPLLKTGQSKVAPGLDLDGAADAAHPAPGTCAHQSFQGLDGEAGVDNQFFRAVACTTFWRGAESGGQGDGLGESPLVNGAAVMVVRGVTSWEDSPHVQVVIATSPDKPPTDVRQKIVAGGSMAMTDNPHWRTVMEGRIENGVLITEPADVRLSDNWVGASGGEFIMRHARLRVKLQPDGELSGVMGGYRPLDNVIGTLEVGGPGVASTAGVDCAAVRKTFKALADGDPDPKTGACTTLSMALDFAAKPAFVFEKGALAGAPGGGATRTAQR
jgi:hypothetical protein